MTKRAKKDRDGLHRRPNSSAGIYFFYFRGADGRLRERSTGTRIYSEARDIRAAELEKIREGEMPSELRDWTLENVAKSWLQQQESLVLPVTFSGYRWILQPILNQLGGKRMKHISPANVHAYRAERASHCSHRTVNREIHTLKRLMHLAGLGATLSESNPYLTAHPALVERSLRMKKSDSG